MTDNLHSTLVAWLKVILPLTALALLSTLFLVARTIDPEDALPFAEVDVEDRLREPRLTRPTWSGMTEDGAALTVSAAEAKPGRGDADDPRAEALVAHYDFPGGGTADLTAAAGRLDTRGRVLTVEGGVVVQTSDGYRIETEALTAALDRTRLESAGDIAATGPMGRLTAGRMQMSRQAGQAAYVLHFTGGVKLLYDPAE
ncbi:MAG: LPS export ABC transporter periplasmic protein LptC [Paracoccaceae bacterium]|nr:MAG: LPS export ABC transporter periplasmic protein LptC [Paracoccaceae bacterium]